GFNFCYDKKLYDRMEHNGAEEIRSHLHADMEYQDRLIRFIENHDEPRAANTFHPGKEKMAAVAVATLPGAKLFHEGQFEGRKARVPVFLRRRPSETANADLLNFHHNLLAQTGANVFRNGNWQLCEVRGWPDNMSCNNIIAWTWRNDSSRYLIIINFSDFTSQGLVRIPWNELSGKTIRLSDTLSGAIYERSGNEMADNGLCVVLNPWNCHFFKMQMS
ncbi:MAG: alpha-amylase, partial [Lentisphaerota bacterium]